jgi:hypothetical protein
VTTDTFNPPTYRKHMELPVQELEKDDVLLDCDRWRRVRRVVLLEQVVYVHFTDTPEDNDPLPLGVPTVVSLWRVCADP